MKTNEAILDATNCATSPEVAVLSSPDAARYIGVSVRTLYGLSRPRGPIPVVRPTAWSVRYLKSDLDAFLASKREG